MQEMLEDGTYAAARRLRLKRYLLLYTHGRGKTQHALRMVRETPSECTRIIRLNTKHEAGGDARAQSAQTRAGASFSLIKQCLCTHNGTRGDGAHRRVGGVQCGYGIRGDLARSPMTQIVQGDPWTAEGEKDGSVRRSTNIDVSQGVGMGRTCGYVGSTAAEHDGEGGLRGRGGG